MNVHCSIVITNTQETILHNAQMKRYSIGTTCTVMYETVSNPQPHNCVLPVENRDDVNALIFK